MNKENQKESAADAPRKGAASRPLWKNIFFAVLVVALFFVALELALALFGIDPVLSAEDPFVGFARSIPLFIEEPQPDGSVLLKTAPNK
ncbi:MAG TPA: hypothetical protein VFA47_04885, partial [Candidatus Manganitrophaceae bacterium]|nr:hypothetical protein [Candidatus Manganitrophaceae bacterium]